jgi:hypothetical protein
VPAAVFPSAAARPPGPSVPGHVMTMSVTSRLADIAVSCSCRKRGEHIETRPVLPAREAHRLWLEHVAQAGRQP